MSLGKGRTGEIDVGRLLADRIGDLDSDSSLSFQAHEVVSDPLAREEPLKDGGVLTPQETGHRHRVTDIG